MILTHLFNFLLIPGSCLIGGLWYPVLGMQVAGVLFLAFVIWFIGRLLHS